MHTVVNRCVDVCILQVVPPSLRDVEGLLSVTSDPSDWNRKIRTSCTKEYRTWVTSCTQRIERTDNRGDTRVIYTEVKRLSDTVSRGVNTRPTAAYTEPNERGTEEDPNPNRTVNTCADETTKGTRNDDQEKLTTQPENVTDKTTRKSESKGQTDTHRSETDRDTRNGGKEEIRGRAPPNDRVHEI